MMSTPPVMDIAADESGYAAWLRYQPPARSSLADAYRQAVQWVDKPPPEAGGPGRMAAEELQRGLGGLLGTALRSGRGTGHGLRLGIDPTLPAEGFRITAREEVRIEGGDGNGLLYGAFALLQGMQAGKSLAAGAGEASPWNRLRMLNHWDNLVEDPVMGSIERVWGGKTLFDWTDLSRSNPRYHDYARLLASVGINGVCVNNVNATAEILQPEMIKGLGCLAAILRDWGIRLWTSIDYASPVTLGGLSTADPLDSEVARWWRAKADEIYAVIPDFGGFVVKADSEGRPGPGDYGRDHVAGSAVLAEALAQHGGILFWRAFVYGRDIADRTPNERAAQDRANHASYEFMGLDGKFADNVILQVKCSATDFQVWEPVHALFGRMPRTPLALELDLAHEYTGYDVHLAWEGHYFSHILNFDTGWESPRCRVADIIAGNAQGRKRGAITAVANINSSRNWFGHLLCGATLFAYGRLAWDPARKPASISREYATLMFGEEAAPAVASLLDRSYDSYEKFNSPLGIGHLWEHLHHFDPDPWNNTHGIGLTGDGIGIDRTEASGSGYIGLYHREQAKVFADPRTCPLRFLLYFHHLPWRHRLPCGRTLIQYLYDSTWDGAAEVAQFRREWRGLHGKIDLDRWAHVYEKTGMAAVHAERWRDLLCRFFLEASGIPDARGRFSESSPSPHARVRSGFPQALEDYMERVKRMRRRIKATTAGATE